MAKPYALNVVTLGSNPSLPKIFILEICFILLVKLGIFPELSNWHILNNEEKYPT